MAKGHRGGYIPDNHSNRVQQQREANSAAVRAQHSIAANRLKKYQEDDRVNKERAAARKETADLQRERALRAGQPDPATVDAVGIPEEFDLTSPGRLPGQRFVHEMTDDEMINHWGDLLR